MKTLNITIILLLLILFQIKVAAQTGTTFKQWGEETLSAIERDFRMPNSALYKETLTSSYAFNWPLGIQFHALVAAGKISQAEALANETHQRYWCLFNNRWGYNAGANYCGDRYYDDNAWMAKGLMELYQVTNNVTYLNRAKETLAFVMSGEFAASSDPMRTSGSIRWNEGHDNWCLCGSAPAAASNLMVYNSTKDQKYLNDGLRIYNWAKTNRWGVGPGYRGYENAVLCQAAIGLYKATGNLVYLNDAVSIGYKMETYYVDVTSRALYETGQWGGHDMTNAYVELYNLTKDVNWLNIVAGYLKFLHDKCKDANGRYPEYWADAGKPGNATLLYQAPVASAYAAMGTTPGGQTKLPDPVDIFRDCNFSTNVWNAGLPIGRYTLADLRFLGVPDNDVSSIRVRPGYRVIIYDGDNFTGASVTKTADVACLSGEGWEDRATSIVVEAIAPTAIVYKDCNFTGRGVNLPVGTYTLAQLNARGINNKDISSIKIGAGFKLEGFESDNFTGATTTVTADNSCLVAAGWNDRITSLRVSTNCVATTIVPYLSVNSSAAQQTSTATLAAGGSIRLSPQPTTGGTWRWTGPNGFTSTAREITISNIQSNQGGTYTTTHTNSAGCSSTHNFVITVTVSNAAIATVYKDCNFGGTAVNLPVGDYTLSALVSRGVLNDDISSLKISAGYEIVVYQNDNFGGIAHTFTAEDACLVDNGINDWISSLRVRTRQTAFTLTIQAENYNAMAGIQTETTTDAGGGLNVGWIEANDWMAFNSINIPTTGSYRIDYRVASPNAGGKLSLDINSGATILGTADIPNTGGWQTWTTVSHTVNINAGTYNFGIFATTGGWNINWWRITAVSTSGRIIETGDNGLSSLDLYPNPTIGKMGIKSLESYVGAQLRIVDSKGVEVMKGTLKNEEIDVTSLKPGLYSAIITIEGKKITKRFVKN